MAQIRDYPSTDKLSYYPDDLRAHDERIIDDLTTATPLVTRNGDRATVTLAHLTATVWYDPEVLTVNVQYPFGSERVAQIKQSADGKTIDDAYIDQQINRWIPYGISIAKTKLAQTAARVVTDNKTRLANNPMADHTEIASSPRLA